MTFNLSSIYQDQVLSGLRHPFLLGTDILPNGSSILLQLPSRLFILVMDV